MTEKNSVRFLGPIQWLSILVLALVPALFFAFSWRPSLDPPPFGTTLLGPASIGSWSVVVGGPEHATLAPGAPARWNVRFCEGCWEQVLRGWIAYGDANGPAEAVPLTGSPNSLGASLSLPEKPRGELYLWLGVETWSGERHTRRWRLTL
jgi:hypothetical protein